MFILITFLLIFYTAIPSILVLIYYVIMGAIIRRKDKKWASLVDNLYSSIEDLENAAKILEAEESVPFNTTQKVSAICNPFIIVNHDNSIFMLLYELYSYYDWRMHRVIVMSKISPYKKYHMILQYVLTMKCLGKQIDCDYVDRQFMIILGMSRIVQENKYEYQMEIISKFKAQMKKEIKNRLYIY